MNLHWECTVIHTHNTMVVYKGPNTMNKDNNKHKNLFVVSLETNVVDDGGVISIVTGEVHQQTLY